MKKLVFILIALMAIASVLVSCQDKESGGYVVEAKNVLYSNNKIATVEAQSIYFDASEYDYYYETIASCSYEKNGFKIKLPKTLNGKFLEPWDDDGMDYITISDKNAKVGIVEFYALDKSGEEIGEFYFEGKSSSIFSEGEAVYVYADRNFTMKGTDEGFEEEDEFSYSWYEECNCTFKKGWNIIYTTYDVDIDSQKVTILLTTNKPSGMNWVWSFDYWDERGKSPVRTIKSIKDVKKNFLRK